MKISSLIVCILTLCLGVATYVYTANQEATMKMVIGASGGVDDANPTGMLMVNKSLDVEVATASKERQDALKASQDALVMLQLSAEARAAAEKAATDAKTERDDLLEKIHDVEARIEEIRAEEAHMIEFLRKLPDMGDDIDLGTAVEKLRTVVTDVQQRNETLRTELGEKESKRKEVAQKAAELTTENNRLQGINKAFFDDYSKNEKEYPILAVDTRWKFVVFSVGENSGLIPGDSTPMLVRRGNDAVVTLRITNISGGQAIAEYKQEDLPAGVQLQVGDVVFREKPAGN